MGTQEIQKGECLLFTSYSRFETLMRKPEKTSAEQTDGRDGARRAGWMGKKWPRGAFSGKLKPRGIKEKT